MSSSRSRILQIGLGLALVVGVALAAGVWWRQSRHQNDPRSHLAKAMQDADASRWEAVAQAVQHLDEIGGAAPGPEELVLRARLALYQNRTEEALALLKRVPDSATLAPGARLMAGQVELRRGRMRYAEAQFLDALRLNPDLLSARRELAYIYGMQTRRTKLSEQLQAIAEQSTLTFDHLFLWCLSRGSVWESPELIQSLQHYIEADPEDHWSRVALADAYVNIGRLDEAEQILSPLPDSDPNACATRVRLALERGDNATAAALLADAPLDHAVLSRYRGRLAMLRRDFPAALEAYRAAEAVEPNHRDSIFGLSQALRLTGHPEEAAVYARLARGHDELATLMQYAATWDAKSDPELPMKLGAACEAIRRFPEARAWYQFAVDRNPLDTTAQHALFRVNQAAASANASAKRG